MKGIVLAISLGLLGVLGDCLMKRGGDPEFVLPWVVASVAVYCLSMVGLYYAFQRLLLGQLGIIYSVTQILAVVAVSGIVFGEHLSFRQWLGALFAVVALLLMG